MEEELLITYLKKYNKSLSSKSDSIEIKKIENDVEMICKFVISKKNLSSKNYEHYNYELFTVYDILNLYNLDKNLFLVNENSQILKSLYEISNVEMTKFKFFLIKMDNCIFEDFNFIIKFNPLIDMFYKYDNESFNDINSLFLRKFSIKSYSEFEKFMNQTYKNELLIKNG